MLVRKYFKRAFRICLWFTGVLLMWPFVYASLCALVYRQVHSVSTVSLISNSPKSTQLITHSPTLPGDEFHAADANSTSPISIYLSLDSSHCTQLPSTDYSCSPACTSVSNSTRATSHHPSRWNFDFLPLLPFTRLYNQTLRRGAHRSTASSRSTSSRPNNQHKTKKCSIVATKEQGKKSSGLGQIAVGHLWK